MFVRKIEAFFGDFDLVVGEDVEIDDARRPAFGDRAPKVVFVDFNATSKLPGGSAAFSKTTAIS